MALDEYQDRTNQLSPFDVGNLPPQNEVSAGWCTRGCER